MPDVHIVVPTLARRLHLLDTAIASLRAQTHPVRVTVVTGGDAGLLTRRYSGSDVQILEQRSSGLSAAINEAWQEDAWSSDVTGWLGDDDALPPWSVAAAVAKLQRRARASMVHGRCLVIDELGEPSRVLRNGWIAARLVGYGMNLLAQPGCLFRTKLVQTVGGLDETAKYAMDVDLYQRLKPLGPVATSRRQLGVFREHVGGLSTGGSLDAAEEARSLRVARQHRAIERAVDRLSEPVTRAIARATTHLPPPPEAYWRPDSPGQS